MDAHDVAKQSRDDTISGNEPTPTGNALTLVQPADTTVVGGITVQGSETSCYIA